MAGRRFFQISIRTLLILTTLVAIFLAYFNRIRQYVREQKIVSARIESLGGKATIRQTSQVWTWLLTAVGDEYFQEVVAVDLDNTLVTDLDLELMGKLQGLKSITIRGFSSDSQYVFPRSLLPQNPNLLPSQISSAGIRRLGAKKQLQSAGLAFTPITDDAMETIAMWSQLRVLDLQATKVTSQGVQRLGMLKQLQLLHLQETKVDDSMVPTLCQLRSLKELDLTKTEVSAEGLLRLREALPSCTLRGSLLDLSSGIDPDPHSMRWKEITRPMWTLSRDGELKLLVLADTAVTDSHLNDLDRLEKVDVIDLRHTKVTDVGIATLQRALPKCKILR